MDHRQDIAVADALKWINRRVAAWTKTWHPTSLNFEFLRPLVAHIPHKGPLRVSFTIDADGHVTDDTITITLEEKDG